ncbi:hypothetical protein [Silvimonas sp.]|uniref:hypothetical protein n=1 Tax=Silvimonas sp. TaxID=2650811 RepID=UPI002849022A|nr:hypothetical protein [Silvimonas sp.]MDR3427819.1 hypothetical protein [Silvimonas sp.]
MARAARRSSIALAPPAPAPDDDPERSVWYFVRVLARFDGSVFESIWLQVLVSGAVAAGVAVWHDVAKEGEANLVDVYDLASAALGKRDGGAGRGLRTKRVFSWFVAFVCRHGSAGCRPPARLRARRFAVCAHY